MKKKTFIFLLLLRGFSLDIYIKVRSLIQLNYLFPKDDRFSTFLLRILQNKDKKEIAIRKMAANRLLASKYVKEKCKDVLLPKIYWQGKKLSNKMYYQLPQRFYIKHISSSGRSLLIDKKKNDLTFINNWIKNNSLINYAWLTREWFYSNSKKFIIESEIDKNELEDYKFFCSYGKPFILQVDLNRKLCHKRNLYFIENEGKNYKFLDIKLHKFENNKKFVLTDLKNAYKVACNLSKDFSFIRVDLYVINKKVYFGELTNLPGSGFEKFTPSIYDKNVYERIYNNSSLV